MKISNPISKATLILIYLGLIFIWNWLLNLYQLTLNTYHPLCWDVFGYYAYLPSIFDFHQLRHAKAIQDMALISPSFYAGLTLPNGNFVMKYPCGNALMFSPFYFIGKLCAAILGYPQNGFSPPYQISMVFCGFFYSFAGLFVLRKVLINFFNDKITAFVLVAIALATNYVEYSTYTSLLTHNILFFVYSCILYVTIRLYKNFSFKNAILLGLLLGIAPLIRPTEIVSVFIPLLYGVQNFKTLLQKVKNLAVYYKKVLAVVLTMAVVGSIQLIYWRYISGHFFVYSYYGETFDFISPHFYYALFSTTNGWLVYTPIMFFALIGIYFCYRQMRFLFWAILMYVLFHMYLTFSWHVWWYSSSFGLRPMIQSYPVLSIALGCFVREVFKKSYTFVIGILCLIFFIWLNIFQTYQAHKGIINISHMSDLYYVKIFGKSHISNKEFKFLDTDEELDSSQIQSSTPIYHLSLTSLDSSFITPDPNSLKKNNPCIILYSTKKLLLLKNDLKTLHITPHNCITISFNAYIKDVIYNTGDMPFINASLTGSGQLIKYNSMKIPNKIGNNDARNFDAWGHGKVWDRLTFDFMIPDKSNTTDSLFISFDNPASQDIYLNNIRVDCIKIK